jgi:hypothetical protein
MRHPRREALSLSEFFEVPHSPHHTTPLWPILPPHNFLSFSLCVKSFLLKKNIFFTFQFLGHHSFPNIQATPQLKNFHFKPISLSLSLSLSLSYSFTHARFCSHRRKSKWVFFILLCFSFALSPACFTLKKLKFWGQRTDSDMEPAVLDGIIDRLLEVRGRPGKQVQLSEAEIRQLCVVSKNLFLRQPNLLELEAPIKICGIILVLILISDS